MADFEFRSLPFRQALLYLRRKLNLPSRIWLNVLREENDYAFQVAGAMKAELLGGLREAVDKAIEQGTTLEDFRKDFDRIVQQQGWNYRGSRGWRTRVIYQTNLRTAHAAGRYQQMDSDRVKARRPYRQYRHGGSQEPRELHVTRAPRGWNGLVLRADDPWWLIHYPPNDWGCSCFAVTLSDADLERLGLTVGEPPDRGTYEWVNPETGEVEDIPVGVGPEWAYAPGASKREQRAKIFEQILSRMDADLRVQVESEIARQTAD
ncbi:MAG: phage minor head protein [Bacteroidota bacterium]